MHIDNQNPHMNIIIQPPILNKSRVNNIFQGRYGLPCWRTEDYAKWVIMFFNDPSILMTTINYLCIFIDNKNVKIYKTKVQERLTLTNICRVAAICWLSGNNYGVALLSERYLLHLQSLKSLSQF